jgi:holo-[acyl-carrier protein] synthase
MILGLGQDIIAIARIEQSLSRFGRRFTNRVFTPLEQAKSDKRAKRAASYAKRFAAKEACAKALGTGINQGVSWRDIGVVNDPSGKPHLHLTDRALEVLRYKTPSGYSAHIHVTLSDDDIYAQAFVIIEAVADTPASL